MFENRRSTIIGVFNQTERIKMKKLVSIVAVVVVMFFSAICFTGAASALTGSTNYVSSQLSKERGMAEARNALLKGGFTVGSTTGSSVYGYKNDYMAILRAMPEKQIIFVIVVGPDGNVCSKLADFLKNNGMW